MTRSGLGVVVAIYAVCLLFFYLTMQLRPAARIYPLALIGGLALLDTLYFLRCLGVSRKNRQGVTNDLSAIFKDFLPRQFFFILCACILYIMLLYIAGFYISSLVFMLAVMLGLKVKPLPMLVTIVVLGGLVYSVFTLFLKVPLPVGVLFN